VQVGESATITQTGAATVPGTVASVGLLPGSSGFAVVVTSDDPLATQLLGGVAAQVSITVLTSSHAVTVPLSAVTRDTAGSTSATVGVLGADGTVTTAKVTLGAVGDTRAAILEGLSVGQDVVVGDRDEALPTSTSRVTNNRGGGPQIQMFPIP